MALEKTTLATEIKALLQEMVEQTDSNEAFNKLAKGLATAVDNYLKTAQVTTAVTGTCATPSGAGTITGSGTGTLN